ncbi:MAG: LemA family protein [Bacteroidetes bacterium]|nr:MAG: LemA family protein [Bacteroidota bacterium]
MQRFFWIFLGLIFLVGGCGYFQGKSTYNNMVVQQEAVEAQWGQVQNVYQRRADLIPNLVETAKGYAEFEQSILTDVAEARAQVGQLTVTKEVLDDPQALERFNNAQSALGNTLSRLLSVAENYPELKANSNFQALMVELEGTENRIAVERKKFNDAARAYNSFIKQFPNNLYAGLFNFEEVAYFRAEAGSEQAPKVSFD